jgi:hypothetical protein
MNRSRKATSSSRGGTAAHAYRSGVSDLPIGAWKEANTGRKSRFSGTTWFRLKDGKFVEELGQEGAPDVVLQQLGLVKAT